MQLYTHIHSGPSAKHNLIEINLAIKYLCTYTKADFYLQRKFNRKNKQINPYNVYFD